MYIAIIIDQFTLKLWALTVAIYVASNFWMTKFLKKLAIKDYFRKRSRDPASHYLLGRDNYPIHVVAAAAAAAVAAAAAAANHKPVAM